MQMKVTVRAIVVFFCNGLLCEEGGGRGRRKRRRKREEEDESESWSTERARI